VDGNGTHTPLPRPSILRGHHHSHSSSSNESQIQGACFCALRFEPSSSQSSLSAKARNGVTHILGLERSLSLPHHVIHKASSAGILIGMGESREAELGESALVPEPASAPPAVRDFKDTSCEVDEDEYGEVIERPEGTSKPLLEELHTEGRPRGLSSESSSSLLSPTMSPNSAPASTGQDPVSIVLCPLTSSTNGF